MNKLQKILLEEIKNYLNEKSEEDYYEIYDNSLSNILYNFIHHNNPDLTIKFNFSLIPAQRLIKIWGDYMRMGVIRDVRGLENIEDIMIRNTTIIRAFTYTSGHTESDPDDDFNYYWGEYINDYILRRTNFNYEDPNQLEIPFNNPDTNFTKKKPIIKQEPNPNFNNIINNPFDDFYDENSELFNGKNNERLYGELKQILIDYYYDYYSTDEDGGYILSDYGLEPLEKYIVQLFKIDENNHNAKLVLIDKMLNVVHQRSDLASWFVEGGSSTLSKLSASPSEIDN